MRKHITIKNDAIQYDGLGQLHLSDCILFMDGSIAIRGDIAYGYIKEAMRKAGSLPPEKTN
jgi:hypothetical protein